MNSEPIGVTRSLVPSPGLGTRLEAIKPFSTNYMYMYRKGTVGTCTCMCMCVTPGSITLCIHLCLPFSM